MADTWSDLLQLMATSDGHLENVSVIGISAYHHHHHHCYYYYYFHHHHYQHQVVMRITCCMDISSHQIGQVPLPPLIMCMTTARMAAAAAAAAAAGRDPHDQRDA
jgi:hypothetical protein